MAPPRTTEMQTLFSTEGMHRQDSFKIWRETLCDRSLLIELERLEDAPFQAKIEVATVGSLNLTRLSQGAVRANTSQAMLRRSDRGSPLIVTFQLAGVLRSLQDDRSSEQRAGGRRLRLQRRQHARAEILARPAASRRWGFRHGTGLPRVALLGQSSARDYAALSRRRRSSDINFGRPSGFCSQHAVAYRSGIPRRS